MTPSSDILFRQPLPPNILLSFADQTLEDSYPNVVHSQVIHLAHMLVNQVLFKSDKKAIKKLFKEFREKYLNCPSRYFENGYEFRRQIKECLTPLELEKQTLNSIELYLRMWIFDNKLIDESILEKVGQYLKRMAPHSFENPQLLQLFSLFNYLQNQNNGDFFRENIKGYPSLESQTFGESYLQILYLAKRDNKLRLLNAFISSQSYLKNDPNFESLCDCLAKLEKQNQLIQPSPIWNFLEYIHAYPEGKEKIQILKMIHSKDLCKTFLLPFAKFQGTQLWVNFPDLFFSILLDLIPLKDLQVLGLRHYYGVEWKNESIADNVKVWTYIKNLKFLEQYIFSSEIDQLAHRSNNLKRFVSLIQKNEALHQKANTLKALFHFIPNGNPHFRLSDNNTFELILELLESHQDPEGLDYALLLLDIFTPDEARQLWRFYLHHRPLKAPSKHDFKKLPIEEKKGWVFALRHMRERNTQLASWVLKHHSDDETLCSLALEWLSTVKKELNSQDKKVVQELTKKPVLKKAAVEALWMTNSNAQDHEMLTFLFEQFKREIEKEKLCASYLQTLLKGLSCYQHREVAHADMLKTYLDFGARVIQEEEEELAKTWVFAMLNIVARGKSIPRTAFNFTRPFDKLLLGCKKIVDTNLWEAFDPFYGMESSLKHKKPQSEVGHLTYPVLQPFEHNRRNLNLTILNNFVNLYQSLLTKYNEANISKYYIDQFSAEMYFLPFLHAEGPFFYRGIGEKQGKEKCQTAVVETLMMGCYPRDLKYAHHSHGNWSKRKEHLSATMFSHDLEEATSALYYHAEDGALLTLEASQINQASLSCSLRIEKEGRYNLAIFGGVARYKFHKIYLHPSWRDDLFLIAGKHPTSQRLAEVASNPTDENKKELKEELKKVQEILKNNACKEIFRNYSLHAILELHRHLVKGDFLLKKVEFGTNLAPLPPQREEINKATVKRLAQMDAFRKEFLSTTKVPFCLGQDEMLEQSPEIFLKLLPNLLLILKPLQEASGNFSKTTLEQLEIFTQKTQEIQFATENISRYYAKLFRLAFFFRESDFTKFRKLLKQEEVQRFLGIVEPQLFQNLLDIVSMYQICRKNNFEETFVQKQVRATNTLIAERLYDGTELETMLQLFAYDLKTL